MLAEANVRLQSTKRQNNAPCTREVSVANAPSSLGRIRLGPVWSRSVWQLLTSASLLIGSAGCTKVPAGGEAKGTAETGSPSHAKNTPSALDSFPSSNLRPDGEPIAKIGSVVLTTGEFEDRMRKETPFVRARLRAEGPRKDFVQGQIKREVFAIEGWRRGLWSDPEVQDELKSVLARHVAREEVQRIEAKVEPSKEELRSEYERRYAEFNKPGTIRTTKIVRAVSNQRERMASHTTFEQAERDRVSHETRPGGRAASSPSPLHVAKSANPIASGSSSGEENAEATSPFVTREDFASELGDEASLYAFEKAAVGEAFIVDAPNAVVLVRKTGQRKATTKSFETAAPEVRADLVAKRKAELLDAFYDRLKKELQVSVDEAALSKFAEAGSPPPTPPAGDPSTVTPSATAPSAAAPSSSSPMQAAPKRAENKEDSR